MMTRRTRQSGFTLMELLAAIGIIAVLSVLTLVSAKAISANMRLAGGTNAITPVLANARALAMKENKIVLVVFRAKMTGPEEQRIEAVIAEWTGESYRDGNGIAGSVDRFAPIPDVPTRLLPAGVKVAGPLYGAENSSGQGLDETWVASSDLLAVAEGEIGGAIIGVMYSPDGTTITRNSQSDSNRTMVDFNVDTYQRQGGQDFCMSTSCDGAAPGEPDNMGYCDVGYADVNQYFCQAREDDEPYIDVVPFLAVFDDKEARSLYDTEDWQGDPLQRTLDLTEYVSANANRIHFNRYTGVVMQ